MPHRYPRARTLPPLVLCGAEHRCGLRSAAAQLCPLQQPLPQFCAALEPPGPMRCPPRPTSLSTIACTVPISAVLHKHPRHGTARNGTHPSCLVQHLPMEAAPLQRCAAPGSPAAFPPPRICAQILPHHGIACCLHPLSRGKTPKGRFWGSGPAHPFQRSLPAEDILHTVVLFGASIRPCPLRIRSKIACTSLWAIPRRCLPRFGPLPCGLALGTCTAEI